ncbi:MAG TPA: hypothetical protein VGQ90_06580 [Stellaceae bacterium]|nr:hypothetical protein [Stellaceae bacterium]
MQHDVQHHAPDRETRRGLTTTASLRPDWRAARAIQALDRLLLHCCGMHEFTDDPACIARIAWRTARRDLPLKCGMLVRSGDPIVELHLWNEHLPPLSQGGIDMAWGIVMDRQVRRSLRLLAIHLAAHPQIVALHGEAALGCQMGRPQRARLAGRYGFEIVDEAAGLPRRVRFFCEDFLFFVLARTFNPHGLKGKPLHRARFDVWMSRTELDRRWSPAAAASPAPATKQAG